MQHKNLAFYLKPFIASILIVSYLFSVHTKRDPFFIAILLFAFLGDVLLNFESQTTHILGLGSFLAFVLLLMIVIAKQAKEIVLNRLLLNSIPFLVIFFLILYFFFDYSNTLVSIYLVTGSIISLLCTFSFYYYLKDRNKKSLYYFLGCLCFILVGFTKMYNRFYGYTDFMKVINNLSYIFSLYFIYHAAISKTKADVKI